MDRLEREAGVVRSRSGQLTLPRLCPTTLESQLPPATGSNDPGGLEAFFRQNDEPGATELARQ